LEEEEKARREIARKDSELKAKLVKELRIAERARRKEAEAREFERFEKLEVLRKKTDAIIKVCRKLCHGHGWWLLFVM